MLSLNCWAQSDRTFSRGPANDRSADARIDQNRSILLQQRLPMPVEPRRALDNEKLADLGSRTRLTARTMDLTKQQGGPLNAPGGQPTFNVVVNPPAIEADIPAVPGTYPILPVLRVTINSAQVGWRLNAKTTDLKATKGNVKDTIQSNEIYGIRPNGEFYSLFPTQTIIERGNIGKTDVDIPLALITLQPHTFATYEGYLYLVFQQPSGAQSPTIKVPFRVTLSGSADFAIRDNKIYFHYGMPGAEQTAAVTGHIHADIPLRLSLQNANADNPVETMPLLKPITLDALNGQAKALTPSGQTPSLAGLPMEWRLSEGGQSPARKPETRSDSGKEISWTLTETPGETDYRIDCVARPDSYQTPGEYGMSLVVVLQPVL